MKRVIDFVIAALCLILFSPLILACWLAIKIGGGPAIYKQERIGRGGRPFNIYKFRSMVVDAEKEGEELLQQENDPRLTKTGKFLRSHQYNIKIDVQISKGIPHLFCGRVEPFKFLMFFSFLLLIFLSCRFGNIS